MSVRGAIFLAFVACAAGPREVGDASSSGAPPDPYDGARAGDARTIGGLAFRWCPAGTFTMGSPPDEPDRRPDEAQTKVTLTKGFWIATFETTQADYQRIMGSLPQ